jgi:hypothetical protein
MVPAVFSNVFVSAYSYKITYGSNCLRGTQVFCKRKIMGIRRADDMGAAESV